jgi:hypothetical protein
MQEGGAGSDAGGDGGPSDSGISLPDVNLADVGPLTACPLPEAGAPPPLRCESVPPQSATIATFDTPGQNSAFGPFNGTSVAGGFYTYGCEMTSGGQTLDVIFDVAAGQLNVSGVVATYSGFGAFWTIPTDIDGGGPFTGGITYLGGPLDVSAYAGIQFDISGNAGPLGLMTFFANSNNQRSATPYVCGLCTGDAGTCNVTSTAPVTGIGATTKTVQIRWTDLTSPGVQFDPTLLSLLAWGFAWTPGETPYVVDVAIDNVQFIPGP